MIEERESRIKGSCKLVAETDVVLHVFESCGDDVCVFLECAFLLIEYFSLFDEIGGVGSVLILSSFELLRQRA